MADFLIPITLFISIAVVAISKLILDFRQQKEMQKTIRHALDSKADINAELLQNLAQTSVNKRGDFKKAVTLLMLSVAMFIGATLINIGNVGYAIATFPLCLAIGFFIIHKVESNKA